MCTRTLATISNITDGLAARDELLVDNEKC